MAARWAIAFLLTHMAAFVLLLAINSTMLLEDPAVLLRQIVTIMLLPTAASWGVIAFIRSRSANAGVARRGWDVHAPDCNGAVLEGLVAGAIALALGTILLFVLDRIMPDVACYLISAIATTVMVTRVRHPVMRAGYCRGCGYDLGGLANDAACPECGGLGTRV